MTHPKLRHGAFYRWPRYLTLGLSLLSITSWAQEMDWHPESELNPEQKASIKAGCCGAYISPPPPGGDATPEQSPINAQALDSHMKIEEEKRIIELKGEVEVIQGYRHLKADHATINEAQNTIHLEGNIVVREPGLLVTGEQAELHRDNRTFSISGSKYVVHESHIRGDAEHISQKLDQSLEFEDASYTYCPPEENAWALKGSRITINPERTQGVARNVTLEVKDIPVFYFPYVRFPVGDQRQSGFLFPSFSVTDSGANVSIPYYFNLAPNYDLTLVGSHLQGHGLLLEGEFRHLSPIFASEITWGYLHDDQGGDDDDIDKLITNGTLTEAQARPFKGQDRWMVGAQQTGQKGRWSSSIDYAKVSDRNYFRDLDTAITTNNSSDTQLNQSAQLSYQLPHWQITSRLQQYQLLADGIEEPYQQLPATSANGRYQMGNWEANFGHEWIHFDHKDSDTQITGNRVRLDYQLSWRGSREWGLIQPMVGIRHLSYQLDDDNLASGQDDNPSINAPLASLDAGLFFEREGTLGEAPYVQTFEPRLFYLKSAFRDHSDLFDLTNSGQDIDFDTSDLTFSYDQLFRTTRFAGGDRLDDADQLSIGLTNRFISQKSGREWLNISIGQIYYFDDRKVTLTGTPETDNDSDIAMRVSGQIADHWTLSSDLLFNDENDQVTQGNVSLRYRKERQLLNFDYRYLRQAPSIGDIKQVSGSAIWPIVDNRWTLMAHVNYDLEREREIDLLGGIEYNDCCYRIRLAARRWLDNEFQAVVSDDELEYDRGIFLEFQLKGLGGIGRKLDTTLEETIDGYADWNTN